jgi:hypothetical protein
MMAVLSFVGSSRVSVTVLVPVVYWSATSTGTWYKYRNLSCRSKNHAVPTTMAASRAEYLW